MKKKLKKTQKMKHRVIALMLALVLTVTGLHVGTVSHAVTASQETVVKSVNNSKLTAKQKEEAKKEDAKVSKKLKETKESKEKNKKAAVVKEIKELRSANSTTYLLSDGSRKLEIFGQDIRYKENGKYVDYDPSLKALSKSERKELKDGLSENAASDYAYVNTAGDAKQYFPKKLNEDNSVVLTKGNHVIMFAPVIKNNEGREPSVKKDDTGAEESEDDADNLAEENQIVSFGMDEKSVKKDALTYSSDKENASFKYTSLTNGVKEEIILEEKPEENIFEFKLNLPGMKIQTFEDSKEIRIVNKKTNKLAAYISAPNIKDAEGNLTYNEIHYETEKGKAGEYILKVVVDKEYLDSEDVKYPLTIDPTVLWAGDRLESANVSDFSGTLDINRKNGLYIRIHNNGIKQYPKCEESCYIDTSGIDTDYTLYGSASTFYGSDVKDAYLNITEEGNQYQVGSNGFGTFVSGTVEVRTPVSTWSPDTITWNNHPEMGDRVWSQFQCTGVKDTNHVVNITDWAQALADRKIENTGLALKTVEEGTGAQFYSSSFSNSNYMSMDITYENRRIGEKDIYTYEDFNTSNGSGKIELSQGDFLYTQADMALPTPQLGLGINRIYNSRNTEQSNFGIGWTCDYDAYVIKDGVKSLAYVDGTGAMYEFGMQQGTNWVCNENPDLSIEIDSVKQTRVISATDTKPSSTVSFTSEYIIKDKNNTKRYFDGNGKLRLIEEANGTFIYIKYHSTYGLIESLYSSKGQKIDFQFAYSGGNYFVSKTTLEDNSSFSYTYTNKRLTKVIHTGFAGNQIEYKYEYNNNGQMSRIIDAMGQTYRIEYDGNSVIGAIYPNNEKIDVYTNYEPLKTRVYTKNANGMVLHYEEYEFDEYGKLLKKTTDSGNVSTYVYNGSLITNTTEQVQYHELQNGVVKTLTPTGTNGDTHLEEKIVYNDRKNISVETDEEGNVTEYTYGDSENLDLETKVKVTSPEGEVTSETLYEYDSKGNLIKETDCIEKIVTTYTYDNDGNVTQNIETLVDENTNVNNVSSSVIAKGLNNSTDTSTYDRDGNDLTNNTISGTVNESEKNTYDTLGRIKTSTDEKNIVALYEYDEFGRTISTTTTTPDKPAETAKTKYDANGRVIEETDKLGRKTTYLYDNMGRVISQTLIYGDESRTTTTAYGYEDNFYVITGTGSNKRLPTVQTVTVRNANNEVVSKVYTDPYGQTVREESNGICVDYTYDKQGNVFTTYTRGVSSTNPATPKLVVSVYDKNSRLTETIQNPVYRNGAFTVDATNSIVTSSKYDESGNLTEETDAKGNKTTYTYNEEGKLTKVSIPDGTGTANDTLYAYDIQNKDASGNIISTTDRTTSALGAVSETKKNGAGQVLSVIDKYEYGDISNTYEYDASGNKIKETLSNGSYITYGYDKKNQLTSKSERNSSGVWVKLVTYNYNEDDLLIKECEYNVDNNTPRTYRYTFYEYDELKRMTGCSEINTISEPSEGVINENKISYKYDIEDKLTEIRYPKTTNDKLKGIKFEYNDYKWLVKIKGIVNNNGAEVLRDIRSYEYYNDSKVKAIKDYRGFLNGTDNYIQKSYQYDVFDRVTNMSYADSNSINSVLEQYTYSYDKNSNIVSENIINNYPANQAEKVNETRTYTYDSLNRMVTSKITDNNNQTVSNSKYTYDKVGNCTKIEKDGMTVTNTYNKLNQLVQRDESKNGNRTLTFYGYDANGNQTLEQSMISPPTINRTIQHEYDTNNQLIKTTSKSGGTNGYIQYCQVNTYNDEGQRISKTDNGATTYYYYQGNVLLYTTDKDGNKTSQNIIGPQDNIIATIRYDEGQHAYFYNKDIRTSVANVVDESGEGVVSYKYDEYGTTTKYGKTIFYNEICYTSGVYDQMTDQYYLNARYYNPNTVTFLTKDSYRGEQTDYSTWNMYAYCGGNPITYVDPSGHFSSSNATNMAKNDYYYNTGKKMPSKAIYYEYDFDNIKKGDIVYEKNGGFGITGHIAIIEGKYKDKKTNTKFIRIIEAIDKGVKRGILDDVRMYEKGVTIYRVKGASKKNRKNAVKFCRSQLGKKYNLDFKKNTSSKEKNWYCSELVWAAYKNQKIDIETKGHVNEPGITPRDIARSSKLKKVKINLIQHLVERK